MFEGSNILLSFGGVMQLNIKTIKVGYLQTNCYIVSNDENCIIIDPGDEFEKIKNEIVNNLIAILITHNHFDHIGALSKFKNEYNVPIYVKSSFDENSVGTFVGIEEQK